MTIKLNKMTREDYEQYIEVSVPSYAKEKQESLEISWEEAMEISRKDFDRLLPNGFTTENQLLYSIYQENQKVGILWVALEKEKAFIYDIEIEKEFRGKGLGKLALTALESLLKEKKIESIGLHVFGHNKIAYNLYKKLGFIEKSIVMRKNI